MKVTTRRSFFQYMAILGLVTFSATPLYAKGTKEENNYQGTPKDGNQCSDCMHFVPETKECKIIEGSISPDAWCTLYYKLP